jgi:hypothetical protein
MAPPAKNMAKNLRILLDEHFPGSREVRDKGLPKEFMTEVVQNDWINRRRLKDAINHFGEHITVGPDGLKPLVLQHLPDKALDKLLPILNACISLGYAPKNGRNLM